MALRESNPYHLEILTQAAAQGVPMEVDVFDGSDPGTLLDTLDGATDAAFTDVLNDVGGGQFRLSRYDPKATPTNLAKGSVVKIKTGGVYRYSWWIEEMELTTASDDEKGGEYWQVSGRGAIAYLDRAVMYNRSYIGTTDVARLVPLTTDTGGRTRGRRQDASRASGRGQPVRRRGQHRLRAGRRRWQRRHHCGGSERDHHRERAGRGRGQRAGHRAGAVPGRQHLLPTDERGGAGGRRLRAAGRCRRLRRRSRRMPGGNVVKTTKSAQDHTGTAAVEDNSEYVVLGNGPHEGQWAWHNEPLGSILRRAVLEQQDKSPTPFNFLTLNFSNTADCKGRSGRTLPP